MPEEKRRPKTKYQHRTVTPQRIHQGFDSVSLLKDNVASERCAILRYQEIADFTNGKDFTTCDIAKHILAEEEEHEQDLQDYLTDIARMKKSFLDK